MDCIPRWPRTIRNEGLMYEGEIVYTSSNQATLAFGRDEPYYSTKLDGASGRNPLPGWYFDRHCSCISLKFRGLPVSSLSHRIVWTITSHSSTVGVGSLINLLDE
jgi:hypothetical protein